MSGSTFIENNSMIGLDRTSNKVTDKVFSTETSRIVKGKTLTVPGAPTPYYSATNPFGGGAQPGFPNTFFRDYSIGTNAYYVVYWGAPINNGGSPITSYNVKLIHYRDSSVLQSQNTTGDTPGRYYFVPIDIGYSVIVTITATNAIGTGPAFITNPVCGLQYRAVPGSFNGCAGCIYISTTNDGTCGYYSSNYYDFVYCCPSL
jgi:hypothetical protein